MNAFASLPAKLFARLRSVAATRPDAVALVVDETTLTYGGLVAAIEQCAGALQARGCGQGDAIAVAVGNSLDFVVGSFATFAIGGVLVPLNPRFKVDELQHYLSSSAARAVIYPPALDEVIAGLPDAIPVRAHSVAELGSGTYTVSADKCIDAPGIYMFSSGSTGKSKRITRTQAQVVAEFDALAATAGLKGDDRILCTVPLYHAHGFSNAMMAALLSGGTLVLPTADFNARATGNALAAHRITIYPGVPFMLKMLADTRFAEPLDLGSLRLVLSAGAPLPAAVHEKFLNTFGVAISQLYGSTETGAMTLNIGHAADKPGSVGRPLAGYAVVIRDEEGTALANGESGEVWFRGPAMTSRYDGLPEVTAQCFSGGWFCAGDLGHLDADGDLTITGRSKLMINVAGYKVDPLEVENVLATHPNVLEAVVIGVPHAGYGEKIKAVVVEREKGASPEAELIAFAAERLADYKHPKLVEFRDEIPRSPLGKILRKYL